MTRSATGQLCCCCVKILCVFWAVAALMLVHIIHKDTGKATPEFETRYAHLRSQMKGASDRFLEYAARFANASRHEMCPRF